MRSQFERRGFGKSRQVRRALGRSVVTALVVCAALVGCSSGGSALPAATPMDAASQAATPISEPSASASAAPSRSPQATPPGDVPTAGNGSADVILAIGVVLPNPTRTPGATNPAVTQGTIHQTICVVGWTSTVRPPSSVTTALKIRQLASGYSFQGDMSTKDYEEDHLISLELGGSPTAEANLWPEPYGSPDGARVKDQLENKLHTLVCSGALSLANAQAAIATNWWSAYGSYVGSGSAVTPVAPAAPAPQAPVQAPAPPPAPVSGVPSGATALCKDGTYSYSAHHQGSCSGHGGVAQFYS